MTGMQREKNCTGCKGCAPFNGFDIVNIILCVLCFVIILVGTSKFGPGVTHDSVAYLFAASTAAGGEGLQYFAYTSPFVQWPPLFPLILAIPELLSIDLLTFSMYFNAIVMALALWIGSRTIRQLSKVIFMPTLFILMGLFSFPLLKMSFFVWSEPLFILFTATVFHILLTADFDTINREGFARPVLLMAVITALACLTRYIGVVIIMMVCLYLFIKIEGFGRKIKAVFLYGFVSAAPTVIYLVRNYMVSGTLVGMRSPSGIPLSTNTLRAVKTVAGWIFPVVSKPGTLPKPVLYLILAALALLALMLLWQILANAEKRSALIFLSAFCILYSVYMIVSATKVAFDPISDRYMIPVMLPLTAILVLLLDGILEKLKLISSRKAAAHKIIGIGAGIILTGVMIFSLAANAVDLKDSTMKAYSGGAGGFNTADWRSHGFLSQMERLEDSDMIYSNNPSPVYFLTEKSVHYTPKTFGIPLYGYEAFLKESENYRNQYIVWFGNETSTTVYTPQQFEKDFTVTNIVKDDSYSIYKLERRNP